MSENFSPHLGWQSLEEFAEQELRDGSIKVFQVEGRILSSQQERESRDNPDSTLLQEWAENITPKIVHYVAYTREALEHQLGGERDRHLFRVQRELSPQEVAEILTHRESTRSFIEAALSVYSCTTPAQQVF